MPFTPSHAVVALPFLRTPLVPAAIAVGAMTPDLPLFVGGLGLRYGTTHAWASLPLTVLVAAALLLVWRCLLRPAARDLSPDWLAQRLPALWDRGPAAALRETFPSPRGTAWLVLSLALGVASHILWDLFTHEGRAGVDLIPALDEPWGPLTGYKWLQYGSGIVGLVVIGVWAILWVKGRDAAATPHRVLASGVRRAWWISLPVFLLVAWVLGLLWWGPLTDEFTVRHLAYRVLPRACGLWGMLTLALALTVQLVRRTRRA